MCGRITLLTREELVEVLQDIRQGRTLPALGAADRVGQAGTIEPLLDVSKDSGNQLGVAGRAQARPGNLVSVIGPNAGQLTLDELIWGFEAPWNGKLVFNTRLESALGDSGMWTGPIREGRCIVPAATFFEPHATQTDASPKTGRPIKRQYEFALLDGAPLLLAGVHDSARERVSVVTTQPNTDVSPVHQRMPLALSFEELPVWLEGDVADLAALADRSRLRLQVAPELAGQASDLEDLRASGQLSLF